MKEQHPLIAIWRQPRVTIQKAVNMLPFWLLICLSFFSAWASNLLMSFQANRLDDTLEIQSAYQLLLSDGMYSIADIVVFTPLLAVLILSSGKSFDGKGKFFDILKGLMFVSTPFIVILPIVSVWLVLATDSFFGLTEMTALVISWTIILGILVIMASILTTIYYIVMVSEYLSITKKKAFFTLVIATAISTFIILVCTILYEVVIGF